MKALVMDDSKAMRMLLKKILRKAGFDELLEAGDGQEGLDLLKKEGKVDLVLVDWNMPQMDGFDFVCAIRSNPAFTGMLLMMITTETEMNQMAKALEAGANEYVMKPFNKDVIFDKLALMGFEVTN